MLSNFSLSHDVSSGNVITQCIKINKPLVVYIFKSNFMQCLFVYFVALRPKSTAMVMARRSVHLTTLFSWASLNKQLTSTLCTYFGL